MHSNEIKFEAKSVFCPELAMQKWCFKIIPCWITNKTRKMSSFTYNKTKVQINTIFPKPRAETAIFDSPVSQLQPLYSHIQTRSHPLVAQLNITRYKLQLLQIKGQTQQSYTKFDLENESQFEREEKPTLVIAGEKRLAIWSRTKSNILNARIHAKR